jgi:hypothetical protein
MSDISRIMRQFRVGLDRFAASLERAWRPRIVHVHYVLERMSGTQRQYRRTHRGLVPVATKAEREWAKVFSRRSRSRMKVRNQ